MKKLFPLFIFLICTATIFNSCKKEHGNETKNVTLNITIPAGTEYKLDLSQYGDADDLARIVTQPANFATSQIDQITMPGVYTFLKNGAPKVGGNGNEVVVLKVYEPAGRKHCDETNITINFTVL
jgi:hypothetical protein